MSFVYLHMFSLKLHLALTVRIFIYDIYSFTVSSSNNSANNDATNNDTSNNNTTISPTTGPNNREEDRKPPKGKRYCIF